MPKNEKLQYSRNQGALRFTKMAYVAYDQWLEKKYDAIMNETRNMHRETESEWSIVGMGSRAYILQLVIKQGQMGNSHPYSGSPNLCD